MPCPLPNPTTSFQIFIANFPSTSANTDISTYVDCDYFTIFPREIKFLSLFLWENRTHPWPDCCCQLYCILIIQYSIYIFSFSPLFLSGLFRWTLIELFGTKNDENERQINYVYILYHIIELIFSIFSTFKNADYTLLCNIDAHPWPFYGILWDIEKQIRTGRKWLWKI